MKKQVLDEKSCRAVGRTYMMGDTLWFALSGSGVEFLFSGESLTLSFAGDEASEKPDNEENYARVAVYVDGVRAADIAIDSPNKRITVFEDGELHKTGRSEDLGGEPKARPREDGKPAVVRVIKLSECAMSTVGLMPAETDDSATITPTEPAAHRIEFIGDSITCGYGVDDEDPLHHFKTLTEDVTRAYAYKTAKALGVEYSMFSTSGYGIITGYTEDDIKKEEQRIPLYYESCGFSYCKFAKELAPHEIAWDFDRYKPELIVINLGTNDDSYCKDFADRLQEYTERYVDFLKVVRSRNPDAYILCTVGIMGQRIYPALEKAVDIYRVQSGDERISDMLFDEQDSEGDGLVADYHPTEVTHTKAAERLTVEIRRIMGW